MDRTSPADLRSGCEAIVQAMGATDAIARDVVDHLVRADLRGHHSHGVRMLPIYAGHLDRGILEPDATPSVVGGAGTVARVDGNRCFGQIAGREAVREGIERATDGIALVGLSNTTHIGRIGEYGERAAREGLLFAGFVNVPVTDGGKVAPLGSAQGRLGTNPLCFGVPAFDALDEPVVMDMATSQVALGKIRHAQASGGALEPEWTTDSDGNPVTDPDAFMDDDGRILPLGGRTTGHKGYGLAVIAELFAGIAGHGFVTGQSGFQWGNSAAFVFADPTAIAPRERIEAQLEAFASFMAETEHTDDLAAGKSTRPDRGVLPGAPEARTAAEYERDGIPIPAADLADLNAVAERFGVADTVPGEWAA